MGKFYVAKKNNIRIKKENKVSNFQNLKWVYNNTKRQLKNIVLLNISKIVSIS